VNRDKKKRLKRLLDIWRLRHHKELELKKVWWMTIKCWLLIRKGFRFLR